MKKALFLAIPFLSLSGCVLFEPPLTPEEQRALREQEIARQKAAREAEIARQKALREEELASFRHQCAEFGFKPGTSDFAECVQKQDNMARIEENKMERERLRRKERRKREEAERREREDRERRMRNEREERERRLRREREEREWRERHRLF